MIRYLRDGGRAAIVLPDGSLTGDGVKQRIREEFLKQCKEKPCGFSASFA